MQDSVYNGPASGPRLHAPQGVPKDIPRSSRAKVLEGSTGQAGLQMLGQTFLHLRARRYCVGGEGSSFSGPSGGPRSGARKDILYFLYTDSETFPFFRAITAIGGVHRRANCDDQ